MTSGVQSEQLAIESVRQPGRRMPVGAVTARECPLHGVPSQARAHMRVIRDVAVVVEVRESVMDDGIVESKRQQHQ